MPEGNTSGNIKSNFDDNTRRQAEDEVRRDENTNRGNDELLHSQRVMITVLQELTRILKDNTLTQRHIASKNNRVDDAPPRGGILGGAERTISRIFGGTVGGAMSLFIGKFSLEKLIDIANGVIRMVDEQAMMARKLRASLALPGSGIARVGTTDIWEMARGIDAAMKKLSNGVLSLEDFEKTMMQLKESGLSVLAPVAPGSGTMVDILRDISNAAIGRGAITNPMASTSSVNALSDKYLIEKFKSVYGDNLEKLSPSQGAAYNKMNSDERREFMKSKIPSDTFEKEIRGRALSETTPGGDIAEFNKQIAGGNGKLVAFSIYLGKLAIATGISTDALIKNGGALYRQEIGFENHGRTLKSSTEAIGQAAELAMLSQNRLAGINRPADEFISDMTSASNVIRFFSTDLNKSKKELIKLNIAESDAINNLIFSLTDVVNMMDSAFKPDLTQSALTLEMIGRYPKKFPSLTAALSKASPEGKLMAMDRLSTFSAPEFEEWKKKGSDMRLIPSFFKDISEDLGITLEKALQLAPEVGKARLETPELLLNSMGLKGGARAFAGFEMLPALFSWMKLDSSQGRQTTDALLQFGAGVNLTKEQLDNLGKAANDATTSLGKVVLDPTLTDQIKTLSAGVYNAFIESFGGKQVTVKNITASGENLEFKGTLNLTIDKETKTYAPGSK